MMFFIYWAGVAQLVEQLICNQQVGGSSPFASSTFIGMLEGNLRVLTPPSWAAVLQYCRLVVEDFFVILHIFRGGSRVAKGNRL